MNNMQRHLFRSADELGLRIEIGFILTLSDGKTLISEALFPDLSNPRGIMVFSSNDENGHYDLAWASRKEIQNLGYGFSSFHSPSDNDVIDIKSYSEMFDEWGWTGELQIKPHWMS